MINIIIRSTILFFILILMLRLMGKRQIGEMQPFELVITLIIADITTIPMSDITVPLLHGIVPLFTLVILHFVVTLIANNSTFFSRLISGKPIIVINENGIDYKSLKALNMTIDDIFEAIRDKGFFCLDEIQYAIVETTGIVNVMPKTRNTPLTKADYYEKPSLKENSLPFLLIDEGKFMKENLLKLGFSEEDIKNKLKKIGINNYKNVLIYSLDASGKVYVQEFNKKYKVIPGSEVL